MHVHAFISCALIMRMNACNSQLQQEIKQHFVSTQASQQIEAAEVLADLSYTLKVCMYMVTCVFSSVCLA